MGEDIFSACRGIFLVGLRDVTYHTIVVRSSEAQGFLRLGALWHSQTGVRNGHQVGDRIAIVCFMSRGGILLAPLFIRAPYDSKVSEQTVN